MFKLSGRFDYKCIHFMSVINFGSFLSLMAAETLKLHIKVFTLWLTLFFIRSYSSLRSFSNYSIVIASIFNSDWVFFFSTVYLHLPL